MAKPEKEEVRKMALADAPNSELRDAMGADGEQWAAAFCAIARRRGIAIDEDWMTTWFCAAIEAGEAGGGGDGV